MRVIIERTAWCRTINTYGITIDEEYAKNFNEWLRKWYEIPEDFVDVTVRDFYDEREDYEWPRSEEMYKHQDYDRTVFLGDIMRDYTSEDIWDNWLYDDCRETDDWEDDVTIEED